MSLGNTERWPAKGYSVALLMPLHLASHLWALIWALLRNPSHLYRSIHLLLTSWRFLGFRSTAGRLSSRLSKSLVCSDLPHCPICTWIKEQQKKSALVGSNPKFWHQAYRPAPLLLARLRAKRWPAHAPVFTILMPVYNTPAEWLLAAIKSVCAQTYAKWELICIDDGSEAPHVGVVLANVSRSDARIRVIRLPKNSGASAANNAGLGEATGDYVCFLDHSDALEPQALHRFAEAVLLASPDMLYSDELLCGNELEDAIHVVGRPKFSYDYYLSTPYFVHLLGVRTTLALAVGGFDETIAASPQVDFILRVLERTATVSHVPDVLYRWRTISASPGDVCQSLVDDLTAQAIRRHLTRLGCVASVRPVFTNVRDIAFRPSGQARVAAIIPTKNQGSLLRACVTSFEGTVRRGTADLFVVDHQSDDWETRRYLAHIRGKHNVLPYEGPFNFSAMMNYAVQQLPDVYTHYLFLNNDVEATQAGWLEHMLGLGCREEIAAVGAMMLYPNRTIQHAGVVVGLMGVAEHVGKFARLNEANGTWRKAHDTSLLCNRDVSAVTAACMLFHSSIFRQLNGFDERFVVGFGDTDLCLRAIETGHRVLMDAHAVLIHHESMSRGKSAHDPHPKDTRLFVARWHKLLQMGDPCYSPYLCLQSHAAALNPRVRSSDVVRPRTVRLVLPRPETARADCERQAARAPLDGSPHAA